MSDGVCDTHLHGAEEFVMPYKRISEEGQDIGADRYWADTDESITKIQQLTDQLWNLPVSGERVTQTPQTFE